MHPTFKDLETELTGSLTGLSAAQTLATPRDHPEKWCVQEIVGHLLLSYATTIQVFESRLAKGRATRAQPTLSQRLGQFYVINLKRFPSGRRAPDPVCPPAPCLTCAAPQLIERVHSGLFALDAQADHVAQAFGDSPAISHIILGPMSIDRWRTFHLIHGRHHIRQILALRAETAPQAESRLQTSR